MKTIKCLSAISKSVARTGFPRNLKKNVIEPPLFHTVSVTRYISSVPSPPTDMVFDGDSVTSEEKKAVEELLKKAFNFDPSTVIGKSLAEWLMNGPPLPEQLQFQQAYSVDGYEVFLDVAGFGEKDVQVYVEDRVLYVKADEKISLKGQPVNLDRSLPIHKFVFIDIEKGTWSWLDGELKVHFPFTPKISANKQGKIPLNLVKP